MRVSSREKFSELYAATQNHDGLSLEGNDTAFCSLHFSSNEERNFPGIEMNFHLLGLPNLRNILHIWEPATKIHSMQLIGRESFQGERNVWHVAETT